MDSIKSEPVDECGTATEEYIVPDVLPTTPGTVSMVKIEIEPETSVGKWPTLEVLPGFVIKDELHEEGKGTRKTKDSEEIEEIIIEDEINRSNEGQCKRSRNQYEEIVVDLSEIDEQQTGLERMYACAKCQQQFIHLSSLTKHVRGHEEEKLSLYDQKKQDALLAEIAKIEQQKPLLAESMYVCAKCHSKFNHMLSLTKHIYWHKGEDLKKLKRVDIKRGRPKIMEKMYSCAKCTRKFNDQLSLFKHVKNREKETGAPVNNDEQSSKKEGCKKCENDYEERQKALLLEISKIENQSPETPASMYACAKCPEKFNHMVSLVKHIRWHKGEESKDLLKEYCIEHNEDAKIPEYCKMRYKRNNTSESQPKVKRKPPETDVDKTIYFRESMSTKNYAESDDEV